MTFDEWLAAQGTLFAACDAVTYGQKVWDAATRIEREACIKDRADLQKDAARYRWLKSRKGLELRTENDHCVWTRTDGTKFNASHCLAEGGTLHAPTDSLDATIDAALHSASD